MFPKIPEAMANLQWLDGNNRAQWGNKIANNFHLKH
jgi:hypothetical protein